MTVNILFTVLTILLWIILLLTALLLVAFALRLSLRLRYKTRSSPTLDDGVFEYELKFSGIKLNRLIESSSQKKNGTKKKKEKKEKSKKNTLKKKKLFNGSLLDIISEVLDLINVFSESFFKKLKIRLNRFTVVCGGKDAEHTALNYGKTVAIVSNLIELLKAKTNYKVAKGAVTGIDTDFTCQSTKADIDITVSFSVFSLLNSAVRTILRKIIYHKQ